MTGEEWLISGWGVWSSVMISLGHKIDIDDLWRIFMTTRALYR